MQREVETFEGTEVIFDWNPEKQVAHRVSVYDESLRDGIQSPTAVDPPIESKKRMLDLMNSVGIEYVDIGLPGAGPRAVDDVTMLANHIKENGLSIHPSCAARTHPADIQAVIDISQATGVALEVMAFLGTDDLKKFAADKEKAVKDSVGDWGDYLAGKDLDGHEHIDDPDAGVQTSTMSSSGGGC